MKKNVPLLLSLVLTLAAVLLFALAAGGNSGDPLASLSYLRGTFTNQVERLVDEKLDASEAALSPAGGRPQSGSSSWQEHCLKQDDRIQGPSGSQILLLAGDVQLTDPGGTVLDVTTGTTVPGGSHLIANHRYLAAEETQAEFQIRSKTAVVQMQGPCGLFPSSATDYYAMASALKTLHLFQGTFTGYGEGFDLELVPTRLQALIMFIRVLGEEDAALSWSGVTPFQDIGAATSAAKYVGYAYEKGYTNGYSPTSFRPGQAVTASQYMEFLLRALGYSSSSNKDLSTTLDRAVQAGILQEAERASLNDASFLRADLVFLSYRALDAPLSDGSGSLRDRLLIQKVFTPAESAAAEQLVSSR